VNLAEALIDAALRFLETGPPEKACLPFDDQERRTWAYWPTRRAGAYTRALTIMGLDEVLDRIEGYRSERRQSLD